MSMPPPPDGQKTLHLVARRVVPAPPADVFAAWTEPKHLLRWWGPVGVTLTSADIDLRVGGRYRLVNRYDDGTVLPITGVFEVIDWPRQLTFTWAHEPVDEATEHTRVTVSFEAREGGTEVVVMHEGFLSHDTRDAHEVGWRQCLDGLAAESTSGLGRRL
jgi:uncharacterized protein YndB with AHSA1/START domain